MKKIDNIFVVHFIPTLEAGGAETQLQNLVCYAKKMGISSKIVTLSNLETNISLNIQGKGIPIEVIDFSKGKVKGLFKLCKLFYKLDANNIVLHSWMYHANFLTILAKCINWKLKIVWAVRRTEIPKSGGAAFFAKICSWFSFFVPNKIVFNSNTGKKTHMDIGYFDQKSCVIPNAIDCEKYKPNIDSSSDIQCVNSDLKNIKKIGVIGRYMPVKGHLNLFKALSLLPSNVIYSCILVGRGISSAKPLQNHLISNKLVDKLVFLGERTDIPELLSTFDFLVLPSDSEGFPNVVAEAMAAGVPCIVTNVGDTADIVGGTGIVVPNNTPENLAKAILFWINLDKEELTLKGIEASKRINDNYSLNNVWNNYKNFYERLWDK